MEEADLLADHIAIMANGHIVAEGTSMDLKSRYGVGYTLTLAKQRADDSNGYGSDDCCVKLIMLHYSSIPRGVCHLHRRAHPLCSTHSSVSSHVSHPRV